MMCVNGRFAVERCQTCEEEAANFTSCVTQQRLDTDVMMYLSKRDDETNQNTFRITASTLREVNV